MSPCIGICSTTYGDLVCRGCNRFAHEITGWNGFTDAQRAAVWERLASIRRGAISRWITVVDRSALLAHAIRLGIAADGSGASKDDVDFDVVQLAHVVLRRCRPCLDELGALGLEIAGDIGEGSGVRDIFDLLRRVDRECYLRSLAFYERSFRIAAQ